MIESSGQKALPWTERVERVSLRCTPDDHLTEWNPCVFVFNCLRWWFRALYCRRLHFNHSEGVNPNAEKVKMQKIEALSTLIMSPQVCLPNECMRTHRGGQIQSVRRDLSKLQRGSDPSVSLINVTLGAGKRKRQPEQHKRKYNRLVHAYPDLPTSASFFQRCVVLLKSYN